VKIPNGTAGTKETLKQMARFVRAGKTHPHIFTLARRLIANVPQKDWAGEARAIHKFVRDKIRYVKDVAGVETVQTPEKTLEFRSGDCDDKSILVASLLQSIGHPVRFVVVGPEPNKFTHVYVETKIGRRWVAVECTEPWELGEVRKKPVSRGVFFV
jgi:transglutaminase-like putative cysteine protease